MPLLTPAASSFAAPDVNMPYASAQADLQAKDNYRGQGQARATAIQQGKLPPIRRIASAKHLAFVPVDEAAVRLNQESRASTLEDLAETPHAPDLVYHSQIASDTFRATFLKFPECVRIPYIAWAWSYPKLASLVWRI